MVSDRHAEYDRLAKYCDKHPWDDAARDQLINFWPHIDAPKDTARTVIKKEIKVETNKSASRAMTPGEPFVLPLRTPQSLLPRIRLGRNIV